ncbi:OLC1v1010020C1 [Oldenlandia corymbosa var. corymbosa]|uniref:OLC1v1010020C1 n=1 Tax=Oldenlandia corymbosa var. corymbosa TaxID=529605 RepID=A0AAV1DTH5_OLDCO|nr:OLC1v1010020C1 [Oldenlandia corymbosa var. corymbosa]
MSGREEESDSDAPEEFTSQQGIEQHQQLSRVQSEEKARVAREGKERRRRWAQKLIPQSSREGESIEDVKESIEDVKEDETGTESFGRIGMLPDEIVKQLAAREKKVFSSELEEDQPTKKPSSLKKRTKRTGLEPVILEEIPPPQCLQSSLDFLKKRKMQVSRSSAVLNNSGQALRLISTSGLLSKR